MYKVVTMGTKDERLNIRIKEDLKDDLKALAEMRGLKMSQLIHTLIVKAIQEERRNDPVEFERAKRKLHKESHSSADKRSPSVRKAS